MNASAIPSILETLMIISFGISWPINIVKLWKSRTAKSNSVLFYFFIWLGYLCGIAAKLLLIRAAAPTPWYETVRWYVLFFYILNTLMVSCGILIWFRNRRYDRLTEKTSD